MVVLPNSDIGELIISLPGFGLSNKAYFLLMIFSFPLSGLYLELKLKMLTSFNSFYLNPELIIEEFRMLGELIRVRLTNSGLFLSEGLPPSG